MVEYTITEQAKGLAAQVREGKVDLEVICRLYLTYREHVDFYKKAYEDISKLGAAIDMKIATLRLYVMKP